MKSQQKSRKKTTKKKIVVKMVEISEEEDDVSNNNNNKSFKYVFIPCDETQPIEEKLLDIPPGRDMECLLDALKTLSRERDAIHGRHIGHNERSAERKVERAVGKAIRAENRRRDVKVAANMQMVQPVALLPGGTKNSFIHVNMYVDDKGISKGLRLNKRASDFTQLVNMPNHVAGDAFVARIFDDEKSDFKRIDFSLDELRSDAKWVEEAIQLNTERRQNLGNAQEKISKMGGSLNTESGMASFGDAEGGLGSMMTENYHAP